MNKAFYLTWLSQLPNTQHVAIRSCEVLVWSAGDTRNSGNHEMDRMAQKRHPPCCCGAYASWQSQRRCLHSPYLGRWVGDERSVFFISHFFAQSVSSWMCVLITCEFTVVMSSNLSYIVSPFIIVSLCQVFCLVPVEAALYGCFLLYCGILFSAK